MSVAMKKTERTVGILVSLMLSGLVAVMVALSWLAGWYLLCGVLIAGSLFIVVVSVLAYAKADTRGKDGTAADSIEFSVRPIVWLARVVAPLAGKKTVQIFCSQCGVELKASDKFCASCGKKAGDATVGLDPATPSSRLRFRQPCEHPPKPCIGCGVALAADARLCTSCGTDQISGKQVFLPGKGNKTAVILRSLVAASIVLVAVGAFILWRHDHEAGSHDSRGNQPTSSATIDGLASPATEATAPEVEPPSPKLSSEQQRESELEEVAKLKAWDKERVRNKQYKLEEPKGQLPPVRYYDGTNGFSFVPPDGWTIVRSQTDARRGNGTTGSAGSVEWDSSSRDGVLGFAFLPIGPAASFADRLAKVKKGEGFKRIAAAHGAYVTEGGKLPSFTTADGIVVHKIRRDSTTPGAPPLVTLEYCIENKSDNTMMLVADVNVSVEGWKAFDSTIEASIKTLRFDAADGTGAGGPSGQNKHQSRHAEAVCSTCTGSGTISETETHVCPNCRGTGYCAGLKGGHLNPSKLRCTSCNGSGRISRTTSHICPACDGMGQSRDYGRYVRRLARMR